MPSLKKLFKSGEPKVNVHNTSYRDPKSRITPIHEKPTGIKTFVEPPDAVIE